MQYILLFESLTLLFPAAGFAVLHCPHGISLPPMNISDPMPLIFRLEAKPAGIQINGHNMKHP